MIYQLYETQRALMEPYAEYARAASKLYRNPLNPLKLFSGAFTPRVASAYDLLYRLGKDYVKPEFGIKEVIVDGEAVGIHERVAMSKPFADLIRFKRYTDNQKVLDKIKAEPVVLIVAPLSGHYATLLRETVRATLQNHKVYITDWKNARLVPTSEGEFHLDDYVNYVQEFIRYIQQEHGNCHTISVCQPTVPVLAAVSLMASRGEKTPISMTMMGGPIDARRSPTAVNNLAMTHPISWFENNLIDRVPINFPGAGRRVYPGFMQHTGFVAMNPRRHANSHYDYFKDLMKGHAESAEAHRKFYDEYNAVLDMDADYYLETLETVFQQFKLVRGTWDVKNPAGKIERVRPQDIKTTALFTVEGELDDISGDGQTEAAHDLCTSIPLNQRDHLEVPGAGHYGIFSGSKWREQIYPKVRDFILAAQQEKLNTAGPVHRSYRIYMDSSPFISEAEKHAGAQAAEQENGAATPVSAKPASQPRTPKPTVAKSPVAKPIAAKTSRSAASTSLPADSKPAQTRKVASKTPAVDKTAVSGKTATSSKKTAGSSTPSSVKRAPAAAKSASKPAPAANQPAPKPAFPSLPPRKA
jgi:poly(3-hydroxybutyrate) depolymerase